MLRRMLNFLRMVKRALFAPVKPMGLEDAFPEEAEGGGPEGHGSASDEGVLVWVPSEARGEAVGKPPPRHSSGTLAQAAVEDDEQGTRKTEAIMGLDFGTSCCKVIIRFPWLAGSPAYPIQFEVDEGDPLFLATEIHYESASGELRLQPFPGAEKQEGLKVAVWKRPEEENSKEFVVGYLALVMKHARDWVQKENQEDLGHFDDFDWSVNVGIPSNGFDGSEWEVFRDVATAAWELSCTRRKITVKSARRALRSGFSSEAYGLVGLRPEVIAEVQGYCRTHMKRDGLHLMVDVGASTLDVCGFYLYEPRKGDPVNTLLTPTVEELGADILKERRPSWLKTIRKDVVVANQPIGWECIRAVELSIDRLKNKMAPFASAFKKGEPLRVFLCGGGGQLSFYRRVIDEVSGRLEDRWLDFGGLYSDPIPRPDSVKWPSDMDEALYHRLAVAFGLSFADYDVGDIYPASAVEGISPPEAA